MWFHVSDGIDDEVPPPDGYEYSPVNKFGLYRTLVGASKRLNTYFSKDGEANVLIDFSTAQPFADDQFRLGRHYLFIKNGAVLRNDSVTDIIRVISHYKIIPTGIWLSVTVEDENGSMAFPLCKVHMLKFGEEMNEIYNVIMQRRDFERSQIR